MQSPEMKKKMSRFKDRWQDLTNPVHIYCRLRDLKISKTIARPLAIVISRGLNLWKK